MYILYGRIDVEFIPSATATILDKTNGKLSAFMVSCFGRFAIEIHLDVCAPACPFNKLNTHLIILPKISEQINSKIINYKKVDQHTFIVGHVWCAPKTQKRKHEKNSIF